jgi:hypothetical protein
VPETIRTGFHVQNVTTTNQSLLDLRQHNYSRRLSLRLGARRHNQRFDGIHQQRDVRNIRSDLLNGVIPASAFRNGARQMIASPTRAPRSTCRYSTVISPAFRPSSTGRRMASGRECTRRMYTAKDRPKAVSRRRALEVKQRWLRGGGARPLYSPV